MKKYLITGSSGFVAPHFLNHLDALEEKCLVLGADMNAAGAEPPPYRHLECAFREIDLTDKDQVGELLGDFQPDYILHLASPSSVAYSWENPVAAFTSITGIFLNLADEVRRLKLDCRMLSVGSSEEYGDVPEDLLPLTEELSIKPASPYAAARVSQEMLSRVYNSGYGVDIVLTRSFNHIGPGQRDAFVIPSFAKKLVAPKREANALKKITTGNIEVVRDFVDVRDVARAYYLLLHSGASGEVYNICSGTGHSLKEILRQMMDILEIDVDIEVDKRLLRPNENKIVVGSYRKINGAVGWKPEIPLENSLQDILDHWADKS